MQETMKPTLILISLITSVSLFICAAGSSFFVSLSLAVWVAISWRLYMCNFYSITRKVLKFNRFVDEKIFKIE